MGKKKAGALKASLASTDTENNGTTQQQLLVPGSTLEDYFHSKKFDPKRDLPVSKHLLVGSPANNAMAMDRKDDASDARAVVESSNSVPEELLHASEKQCDDSSGDAAESRHTADPSGVKAKPLAVTTHAHARSDTKDAKDDDDDASDENDGASDCSNHDEYEDDYESESPSPDASVAGMTLSDYLQAKEAGNTQDNDSSNCASHSVIAGKQQQGAGAKPKKLESAVAAPKKPSAASTSGAKKPTAASQVVIPGMSLDHYLGASSAVDSDSHGAAGGAESGDALDSDADSKSPTLKRKKSKAGKTSGAKALLAAMPKHSTGSSNSSASPAHADEYVTPFQKRQTKKLRAKLKQQQQQTSSGSVSKSMLLGESTPLALQTKAIAIAASSSTSSLVKDKDRRRSHQHQQSSLQAAQHPLPKLVTSSSLSAHSLASHKDQHHHHDGDDSSGSAGDDDDSEKLPPLPHY